MDQPSSYHHTASEQSQSYEVLMPGTSHVYHRFETSPKERKPQRIQAKDESNNDGRKEEARQEVSSGARKRENEKKQRWSLKELAPMHVVEEPAITEKRSKSHGEMRMDASSPKIAQPFPRQPVPFPSFPSKGDEAVKKGGERSERDTHAKDQYKTRILEEDLQKRFEQEGARLQAKRDAEERAEEEKEEEGVEEEDDQELINRVHREEQRRVAFSENLEKGGKAGENEKEEEEEGRKEEGVKEEEKEKEKVPMSKGKKRMIIGTVTFIVTTIIIFVILALFNPSFVQKTTKTTIEGVEDSSAAALVSQPTDLGKALVYSLIGGGVAVALPYGWKFLRGATNMPPNKILDDPDDKEETIYHQRRRHRRRRSSSSRHHEKEE